MLLETARIFIYSTLFKNVQIEKNHNCVLIADIPYNTYRGADGRKLSSNKKKKRKKKHYCNFGF